MKSSVFVTAALAAFVAGSAALPARAQYANEFVPAKLIRQGTTSKPIAGTGVVVVQVQIFANGSHKAIKVIRSSNARDNAAAMDIASKSTYRPAHRGKTPVTAFYDFSLKFTGKAVAQSASNARSRGPSLSSSGTLSPAAEKIANMIRAKQYAQAKSSAEMALISAPGDNSLRQMLGIAAYDANDYVTAAAAFDKVPAIGKQFQPIAAASFASAAVQQAQSNPSVALAYAQKAVAISPETNSRYALGVAQLANDQNAAALATLKSVHADSMNDSKMSTAAKVNIDAELISAYLANNDTADAQSLAAEVKQLDPTSTAAARVIGSHLLQAGVDSQKINDDDTALKDYEQAADQGDPEVAVTADTQAAFLLAESKTPDYAKVQTYAEKALAIKPDDPQANFAEGIALTGQWKSKHDDALRQKALDTLQKADQQAKSSGNEALSLNIETFIKQNLNATPGA